MSASINVCSEIEYSCWAISKSCVTKLSEKTATRPCLRFANTSSDITALSSNPSVSDNKKNQLSTKITANSDVKIIM